MTEVTRTEDRDVSAAPGASEKSGCLALFVGLLAIASVSLTTTVVAYVLINIVF